MIQRFRALSTSQPFLTDSDVMMFHNDIFRAWWVYVLVCESSFSCPEVVMQTARKRAWTSRHAYSTDKEEAEGSLLLSSGLGHRRRRPLPRMLPKPLDSPDEPPSSFSSSLGDQRPNSRSEEMTCIGRINCQGWRKTQGGNLSAINRRREATIEKIIALSRVQRQVYRSPTKGTCAN